MEWINKILGRNKKPRKTNSDNEIVEFDEFLKSNSAPSLRLILQQKYGNSKCQLGGSPLLPLEFIWPISPPGNRLSFLCQLDLAEFAETEASKSSSLPKSGLLSFFYDLQHQPWGFDPTHQGAAAVYFFSNDLVLKSSDENYEPKLPYQSISWKEELTHPDPQANELNGKNLRTEDGKVHDEADDYYFDFLEKCYGNEPVHRFLGYPQLIQSDWRMECELVSHGISCADGKAFCGAEAKEFENSSMDWRLLLQLDSDDKFGMWGDGGKIYFCIKDADLRARNFSQCRLILQCC
jgi:uncharacterized protein YwqG